MKIGENRFRINSEMKKILFHWYIFVGYINITSRCRWWIQILWIKKRKAKESAIALHAIKNDSFHVDFRLKQKKFFPTPHFPLEALTLWIPSEDIKTSLGGTLLAFIKCFPSFPFFFNEETNAQRKWCLTIRIESKLSNTFLDY